LQILKERSRGFKSEPREFLFEGRYKNRIANILSGVNSYNKKNHE